MVGLIALLGSASSAAAAATARPSSELMSVSCPVAPFCVAVGTTSPDEYATTMRTLFEVFGGKSWSIRSMPTIGQWSGLFGVSCPATNFCAAVGYASIRRLVGGEVAGRTLTETYDGRTWHVVPSANPGLSTKTAKAGGSDQLWGVSCPTRSTCVAVGQATGRAENPLGQPVIEKYQRSRWSAVGTPTIPGGGVLSAVSCPSARFCVAVGTSGAATLSEVFDGTSWSVVPSPTGPTTFNSALTGVSCPSIVSCHAVGHFYVSQSAGESPLSESYAGAGWTLDNMPTTPGGGELNGISCARALSCTSVGVGNRGSDGT